MNPAVKSLLNRLQYGRLPGPRVGINRILHDKECSRKRGAGKYPYLSRFYDPKAKKLRGLPETVRYGGGKGNISLANQWQNFFAGWNSARARKYLMRIDSGWVNSGPWPKVEQLGCGGDYVVVTHIESNRAYIRAYDNDLMPSDYPDINFLQQFTVAYNDDSLGLPDCGEAFTFPICKHGDELWISTDDITFVRMA